MVNMHDTYKMVNIESKTPYSDITQTKKSKKNHIKRPMNAFIRWSQLERRKMIEKFPNANNAKMSTILGGKWRTFSEKEKMPFVEEAQQLKMLHLKEYPDYKYKPKKKHCVLRDTKKTKNENKMKVTKERKIVEKYPQFSSAIYMTNMKIKKENDNNIQKIIPTDTSEINCDDFLNFWLTDSLSDLFKVEDIETKDLMFLPQEDMDFISSLPMEDWERHLIEYRNNSPLYNEFDFDYEDILAL
eukprot:GFUD01038385.1.p1 GENE.GFUD01038385.1~~GFUD01038385.1.p1  ORF type:complete len:256 (+),score=56.68 GFUD01038385.1:40-768(+)